MKDYKEVYEEEFEKILKEVEKDSQIDDLVEKYIPELVHEIGLLAVIRELAEFHKIEKINSDYYKYLSQKKVSYN